MELIDLHRHLEGSIRPATVLDLARRHHHWLAHEPHPYSKVVAPVRTAGLIDYLQRIDVACSTARAMDDWAQITREAIEDCVNDGLSYVELRFSPWFIHAQTGLDPIGVISDAAHSASVSFRLPVGLIGIVLRDLGPDAAVPQMNSILSRRQHFCGVDLAGDEAGHVADGFTAAFAMAHDAGLRVTIHAGEAAGPASVWAALALRPDRIGHGVRAAEDAALMQRLAADGITVECALTSNVQTQAAASVREHPIRKLMESGVSVCLNTDNPTPSATRLSSEYRRASTEVGLSDCDIKLIARNSARAAFSVPE